jgi:hypothetical protein
MKWCNTCDERGYVVKDKSVVQCDDCKGHWHWHAVLTALSGKLNRSR